MRVGVHHVHGRFDVEPHIRAYVLAATRRRRPHLLSAGSAAVGGAAVPLVAQLKLLEAAW